jgi:hypothetical protein
MLMKRFDAAGAPGPAVGGVSLAGLSLALALLAAPGARAAPAADEPLREAWRATMARTPAPGAGCFRTDYPSRVWQGVACVAAPTRPNVKRGPDGGFTVGNGADYSAVVSGKITSTVGSFPTVTGVTSETDQGSKNVYSLQINSQFFASPTCSGATNPSNCLGWEQFVYDSEGVAFMQYWLINYGSHCPSGWMAYSGDCYKNSRGVGVPREAITALETLKMSGTVIAGGLDTLVFTAGTKAYSTTGEDSVVDLAGFWNASEFNIIGDGGGSKAVFNKGASLTVNIALTDGSTQAPTCESNDGTTGETNNLTLGKCVASAGATPSVAFTESRAK